MAEAAARRELPEWLAAKVVLPGQTINQLRHYVVIVYGTVNHVSGGTVNHVYGGGTVIKTGTSAQIHVARGATDCVIIDRTVYPPRVQIGGK